MKVDFIFKFTNNSTVLHIFMKNVNSIESYITF